MSPRSNTLVVPMYNAGRRIGPLHDRLVEVLATESDDWELVFVDDGSTDDTWAELVRLSERDGRVRPLRLTANFGQTGALGAGFSVAAGDVVVTLDDDLELDPVHIVDFAAAVRSGADFVSGARFGHRNPVRAVASSFFNRRAVGRGAPFADMGCGLNAMTREVASALALEGWEIDSHRFKFRIATLVDSTADLDVPVARVEPSSYGVLDLAASALDVEVAYGNWSRSRVAAVGVGLPLGITSAALLSLICRRRPAAWLIAGCGGVSAAFTALVIRRYDQRNAEMRQRPAWEIERSGSLL